MSKESPSDDIIYTATVAIFSPDMKRVVMVVNLKLKRILPPGGKFDKTVDGDIIATAFREVKEEVWLVLSTQIGTFLNRSSQPVNTPEIINVESFRFINGAGWGQDSLFFFRLDDDKNVSLLWQLQGFFVTKNEAMEMQMEKNGNEYGLFLPPEQKSQMKDLILSVMK